MKKRQEKKRTLWREQLVQEFVHDRIVEHLRHKRNPKAKEVHVPQRSLLPIDRQADDRNSLSIVQFSI